MGIAKFQKMLNFDGVTTFMKQIAILVTYFTECLSEQINFYALARHVKQINKKKNIIIKLLILYIGKSI